MSLSSGGNTLVMSSFGSNVYKDQKATFWKKNAKNVPGSIKPVYGAQHPPIQEMPSSGSQQNTPKKEARRGKHDAFQDFQDNTEDAWDDGDDDLILMANFKMSLKDVHSTAMQVISDHSQKTERTSSTGSQDNGEPGAAGSARPGSPHISYTGSVNNTPTHGPSGPGVGIRLNTQWRAAQMPKPPKGSVPDRETSKIEKFKTIISSPDIELDEIRNLSWSGIPRQYRPVAWKILSGYIPPSEDRRELTLQRKRQEYFNFVTQYYDTRLQEIHSETFRQITIDIPRMSPLVPLFQQKLVQEIFERILYIWAIRHPASGYVQGINDLVTPFFVVFLSEFVPQDADLDNYNVGSLDKSEVDRIEADSFWCFSKLMDGIQDNYTFAQPGIQLKVNALKDIITRVDNVLHKHLERQNVEYLQFTFRWMNNLLMREIPLRCTIRLWDSYLSETSDFASLHLYVCAALLLHFAHDLKREKDFHGLMLMLQNLPTYHWNNDEINLLLAEAYKLKYTYADAPRHLSQKK